MINTSVPYLKGNEKKYLNECIKENYVSAITTCGVNSEIFNELTNSQNIEKIAERFLSESERLLINNGDLFNE